MQMLVRKGSSLSYVECDGERGHGSVECDREAVWSVTERGSVEYDRERQCGV